MTLRYATAPLPDRREPGYVREMDRESGGLSFHERRVLHEELGLFGPERHSAPTTELFLRSVLAVMFVLVAVGAHHAQAGRERECPPPSCTN